LNSLYDRLNRYGYNSQYVFSNSRKQRTETGVICLLSIRIDA
jgi:hypothetical protein